MQKICSSFSSLFLFLILSYPHPTCLYHSPTVFLSQLFHFHLTNPTLFIILNMLSFSAVTMGFALLTSVSAVPTPMTGAMVNANAQNVGANVGANVGSNVGANVGLSADILDGLISADTNGALGLKVAARSLLGLSDNVSLGLGNILGASTGVKVSARDMINVNVAADEKIAVRDIGANVGVNTDDTDVGVSVGSLLGADIGVKTGLLSGLGAKVGVNARDIGANVGVSDDGTDVGVSVGDLFGAKVNVLGDKGTKVAVQTFARSHDDDKDEEEDNQKDSNGEMPAAHMSAADYTKEIIAKLTHGN